MLILDRYLTREIAKPLVIFCGGLLLLFANFTAIRYMSRVADGLMPFHSVLPLVMVRAAVALEILLPVALHLSVVVTLGRLYTDSEMTALFSSGVSPSRIIRIVFVGSLVIAGLVAYLSIYVRPWANENRYRLEREAAADVDLNEMQPGHFYENSSGTVLFFQRRDQRTGRMQQVFIQSRSEDLIRLVWAEEAHYPERVESGGARTLVCSEAVSYEISRNRAAVREATSDELVLEWEKAQVLSEEYRRKAAPTWQLAGSTSPKDIAEFQWRLSTPVAALLMGLLGFPLGHARARQGKYAKLFVSVVSYATFYNLNMMVKTWVEKGMVGTVPGIWWVHLLLGILVAGLLWRRTRNP
ncbi:Permease YjgP/YjgQ family protein [Candidatus Methylomirabilis lanthanidiphila]|uniref:Lipopolysaccharide export system permease protein LptF n=1 Tax=Candidatus Methylomirabilis lanthanidiphila TaxID=2211376 RepID=A0A564ZJ42_9BACT|nr:LPS export ABC transporter permease LptF [Candidatus Methylomirabilis lanthanidiphila]VUZ85314.1 Permease YjgP/YjgQ family protein [Candidatus Methylomirabilis lanthanidiphila]